MRRFWTPVTGSKSIKRVCRLPQTLSPYKSEDHTGIAYICAESVLSLGEIVPFRGKVAAVVLVFLMSATSFSLLVSTVPERASASLENVSLQGFTLVPIQEWTSGDVDGFDEGDSIPYKLVLTRDPLGGDTETVWIGFDFIDSNTLTYGIDYLTRYWLEPPTAPYNVYANSSAPFYVNPAEGTITSQERLSNNYDYGRVIQTWRFTIEFAGGVAESTIRFGVHLAATDIDSGYYGASYFPGSSLHVRIIALDPPTNSGNRDVPISLSGVSPQPKLPIKLNGNQYYASYNVQSSSRYTNGILMSANEDWAWANYEFTLPSVTPDTVAVSVRYTDWGWFADGPSIYAWNWGSSTWDLKYADTGKGTDNVATVGISTGQYVDSGSNLRIRVADAGRDATDLDYVEVGLSWYSIVFVPLNWKGSMESFRAEASRQSEFYINSLDVLTSENVVTTMADEVFQIRWDESTFTGLLSGVYSSIISWANTHGYYGTRYVAITDQSLPGLPDVAGITDGSPAVVCLAGWVTTTAHELAHTYCVLDEYNYTGWHNGWRKWWLLTTGPGPYPSGYPNSYPRSDRTDGPGREFGDGSICTMGYADVSTNGHGYCTQYCKPWMEAAIENNSRSLHVDSAILTTLQFDSGGTPAIVDTTIITSGALLSFDKLAESTAEYNISLVGQDGTTLFTNYYTPNLIQFLSPIGSNVSVPNTTSSLAVVLLPLSMLKDVSFENSLTASITNISTNVTVWNLALPELRLEVSSQNISKGDTVEITVKATRCGNSSEPIENTRLSVELLDLDCGELNTTSVLTDSEGMASFLFTSSSALNASRTASVIVSLNETGYANGTARADVWILVNNPPTASLSVEPSIGDVATVFEFSALGCLDSEDLSEMLEVRWDFDGDTTWDTDWSTEKAAQWQYSEPGLYTVRLEVRDTQGLTNNTTMQVEVVEAIPEFSTVIVPVLSLLFLVAVVARSRLRQDRRKKPG